MIRSLNKWRHTKQQGNQLWCHQYGSQLDRALWGSRGTFAVLEKAMQDPDRCKKGLEDLKNRKLTVQMNQGNLNADGKGTYDDSWQKNMGELLKQVDGLVPNSWLELKAVQQDLGWNGNNYNVAHYGVDPKIFLDADPKLFPRNYRY